jgi:hypothetical protein
MAAKNIVLQSINFPDEGRCVDIFRRLDGTCGFEEFRRDIEDERGWFPIGFFGEKVFDSEEAALREARATVPWLDEVLGGG